MTNSTKQSFWQNHGAGEGGVGELVRIGIPLVISQGSQSLMLFTDRLILSPLGELFPSASMLGGFSSFLLSTFFIGLVTYITPLTAQFSGANQKNNCSRVLGNGIYLAFFSWPILLVLGFSLIPHYLSWAQVPVEEKALTLSYFNFMNWGVIIMLLNMAISSYFSGLQKSKIVMYGNVFGMLVNIPLTYGCVHMPLAWTQIQGAALGTIISNFLMLIYFVVQLVRHMRRENLSAKDFIQWDPLILKKLIKFGTPTGIEFFLSFFAFNTFVGMYHSFGKSEALALTIDLNWDILLFLPIWGLNLSLMSVVGRNMGANRPDLARRSTFSALKIAYVYAAIAALMILIFVDHMVTMFLPLAIDASSKNMVMLLGSWMLCILAFHIFVNSTNLIFSGTLRACGDTSYCMYVSLLGSWAALVSGYAAIHMYQLSAKTTWLLFVFAMLFVALAMVVRFFQGKWQRIKMV